MKNILSKKELIIIILLILFFCIIKAFLPLLIIIGIVLFIKVKRKPKIEQKPQKEHEVIDTSDFESIKAMQEECEHLLDIDRQVRQETDLRQFKGRSDVTKEELAQYMYEQRRWDGIHERHIQMEEIIKYCNLTMDDIEWVENELQHYHPRQDIPDYTLDNKCCYIRDMEEKAVSDYKKEQRKNETYRNIAREEREFKQHYDFMQEIGLDTVLDHYKQYHDDLMDTYKDSLREYDYDAWLKQKGYTK